MSKIAIQFNQGELTLTGALNQSTVESAFFQIIPLFEAQPKITVNLQQVTECDSASLAFLMALLREAKKRSSQLTFIHMSKQMCDLAKVSGILPLLQNAESVR